MGRRVGREDGERNKYTRPFGIQRPATLLEPQEAPGDHWGGSLDPANCTPWAVRTMRPAGKPPGVPSFYRDDHQIRKTALQGKRLIG
jgi:hypothetical protein